MREGICLGFSLRFLEEYHLLEKVGPGEEIFILACHPKNQTKIVHWKSLESSRLCCCQNQVWKPCFCVSL